MRTLFRGSSWSVTSTSHRGWAISTSASSKLLTPDRRHLGDPRAGNFYEHRPGQRPRAGVERRHHARIRRRGAPVGDHELHLPGRARLSPRLPHHLIGLRATLVAAVFGSALATENPAPAQRADSNIGLEGGHSGLVDSVLATPNRKTPVPQDNIFATAPGAQQAAPMPQSNTKAIGTPRIINRIFPEAHQ